MTQLLPVADALWYIVTSERGQSGKKLLPAARDKERTHAVMLDPTCTGSGRNKVENGERTKRIDNVRSALMQLQTALQDMPGSAAVVSAYLPGTGSCEGLVGGPVDAIGLALTDAAERVHDIVRANVSVQKARDMLLQAMASAADPERVPDKF